MSILSTSLFALARPRLFLDPDTTRTGSGNADLLAHLPGGNLLTGGTQTQEPALDGEGDEGLPREWTQENADGEKPAAADKPADDEDKPEEDAVPAPALDELLKTLPEAAQTHWGELTKERDTLKTEKDALAKEVETLKATTPAPRLASTATHPLSGVESEEGLAWHTDLARDLKSWARRNLAVGGEMPADLYARAMGRKPEEVTDEERQKSAEEAAGILERAERMEEHVIPSRRDYLKIEREARGFVEQHYADMLKPQTEDGKVYAAFLQQFPQVRLLPRWPSALAAMVKGHQVMEAEAAARAEKAKGAEGKTPVAPPLPGRNAAPANGAAKPNSPKPKRTHELSASMGTEALARIL